MSRELRALDAAGAVKRVGALEVAMSDVGTAVGNVSELVKTAIGPVSEFAGTAIGAISELVEVAEATTAEVVGTDVVGTADEITVAC